MTVRFIEQPEAVVNITSIEASRRKKFPEARDYSFPELGGWVAIPAIAAFDPAWKKSTTPEGYAAIEAKLRGKKKYVKKSDYGTVGSWLARHALRILNEDAARPERPLTLAEIENYSPRAEQLAWTLYERVIDEIPDDYAYNNEIDKQCYNAAVFALDVWTPEFMSKLSAAGRKGGSISRRGKAITVDMLLEVEGYSKSIQAERLGCSVSTVARRRRELGMSTKPEATK
jgi:transposase